MEYRFFYFYCQVRCKRRCFNLLPVCCPALERNNDLMVLDTVSVQDLINPKKFWSSTDSCQVLWLWSDKTFLSLKYLTVVNLTLSGQNPHSELSLDKLAMLTLQNLKFPPLPMDQCLCCCFLSSLFFFYLMWGANSHWWCQSQYQRWPKSFHHLVFSLRLRSESDWSHLEAKGWI